TGDDTAKAITLSATDADGDALTYTVGTGPTHGTLSGTAPNLTYTATAPYSGSDAFTFTAKDLSSSEDSRAAETSTVSHVKHAPGAASQAVSTGDDTPKAITLSATDADSDALTYTVAAGPTHGTLSGTAPNLTYTATAPYSGSDSFTFTAKDLS